MPISGSVGLRICIEHDHPRALSPKLEDPTESRELLLHGVLHFRLRRCCYTGHRGVYDPYWMSLFQGASFTVFLEFTNLKDRVTQAAVGMF